MTGRAGERVKERAKEFFCTKNIVTMAMLAAVSYGLSWLEIPIFAMVPVVGQILRLDFSNLATMLGGYLTGPVGAVLIECVKQLLCFITKPTFGGVGELANLLMGIAFALPPAVLYRYKKGIGWVIIGMGIGCVCQICVALLCNRFITFPLVGEFLVSLGYADVGAAFADLWPWFLAFNVIKSASVSILTFLLYKRLSVALKRIFAPRKKANSLAKKDGAVYNIGMDKTVTKSAEETERFAERLASGFKGGEVVLLSGDLGAGKTVFAKGVAKALGVKGDVKSPTFTLCCEYSGDRLELVHIDAYRLHDGAEAEACGINEKFGRPDTVTLIEWPSQIESVLPRGCIRVDIARLGDNEREITVNAQQ